MVEHEFGHQYWYGMVATNEFEDAWMDEGINSYTEVKVLDSILGKNTSILNIAGATLGEREEQRVGYIGSAADRDPMAQKAYEYYSFGSYGGITYGKTACVLLTLEGIVGEDTMAKAMRSVLHEVSLHSSRERRFPEDDRRSFRQRSALVLQPGRLRIAGAGLRRDQRRFLPRELVRDEKDKGKKKDKKTRTTPSTSPTWPCSARTTS